MANVLDKIVADKKIELIERKSKRPLESFKHQAIPTNRDFYKALAAPGTQFILECKKASPSKGLIREPFDLAEITRVYKNYASCISVLTDEKYFQGSFDYLEFVRSQVEQPLICKDFFIDEYQIYLARIYGGDAILLMLSVLDDTQYQSLEKVAKSLNMAILTEVSNEAEVHRALALNAQIIGINNRDLRDLSTNLATTEALRKLIPDNKVVISESGIYTHQDVKRLAPLCNGFLIGSSLMAERDLERACRSVILGENKVCGLTRSQDAIAAYESGAVYGGLIFAPKSPRFVDLDCAKQVMQSAPLAYVGVFVNATIADVVNHAQSLKLAAVQLHGQEDAVYINELRPLLPSNCQIWKAQAVKDSLPAPVNGVDRHLYDTHSDTQAGGTGKTFDWAILKETKQPFMLAGGLNPENIQGALYQGAHGLDLNSGVEQSAGKKCPNKLNDAFISIRKY
ncbi:MAG: indole-3-glycerol phosphate synthase/phosphoribosylanthranilate isomerase [Pseudoalteromonas rhizosphaerae]|jgi:indole-3-glycerol phosphate synthase/phosphoribosylanthranilate isomerase|uniref:Multifunctional fusion protein n=1 Tax=Pseudoalteromonas neustonica TaxID=1840331 RepID=A0ABY3FI04_9GAMM|nr:MULTISPECIES: bifunctional indole-3-glycerol-phosphate synthase TrpC/phosphoribosylanthranilate isomerase TrpF [Pseudoalteromonas]MBB1308249.1 bifunctional indole-3-glycerol-phosphate synthase TrpC/phosphoribosylanthranilate isomerase TrpF [Pseudoalteromonas sp. SR41-8]MBB1335636.1 bifunctional indole-3-glycerol-phosphate synthase TrpC/phosphoribosylanthranilate isomerase TrpF [Pseudoalteromonas sp. SR41-6]MBB1418395.1 bifunctional indole-3-glycerol-phosphate synthase TrpC/phosphoribosylanthr|tara:strand:+ start:24855 stop:26219 length:1365 start_codon:yes stop_codon:yes gene_type:complete